MPLPGSPPITLSQIQSEFSAANLQAASTAAGLDPLPTSMLDFLGLSAYTKQTYTYLTPGTYYLTIPANKPDGLMNVLCVGSGGGGGGAIAGNGYDGEPGGYSGSAGGGGGGGAVSGYISSLDPVVAGQTITIVVAAGGLGASGISSVPGGGNIFKGDEGSVTYVNWRLPGEITALKICWATGGWGGRTFNSNYRFTAGKLTNGNGGDSGIATAYTYPYGKPTTANAGGPASGSTDAITGGGGGGAGGAGATFTGGVGASITLTGVSGNTLGAGGQGGNTYGNGNGPNGANVGDGGGGAESYVFYNFTPVSYTGGDGAIGGCQVYV